MAPPLGRQAQSSMRCARPAQPPLDHERIGRGQAGVQPGGWLIRAPAYADGTRLVAERAQLRPLAADDDTLGAGAVDRELPSARLDASTQREVSCSCEATSPTSGQNSSAGRITSVASASRPRDAGCAPGLELGTQLRVQAEAVLVEIAEHVAQVAMQCGRQREAIVKLVVPVDERRAIVGDHEPRDDRAQEGRERGEHVGTLGHPYRAQLDDAELAVTRSVDRDVRVPTASRR